MVMDSSFGSLRVRGIEKNPVGRNPAGECTAERESQVNVQLSRLRTAIEGVGKEVVILRERLQLVSRAEPPTTGDVSKLAVSAECLCPLADSLDTATNQVLRILREVGRTLELLEI